MTSLINIFSLIMQIWMIIKIEINNDPPPPPPPNVFLF